MSGKRVLILDIPAVETARISKGLMLGELAAAAGVCRSSVARALRNGRVGLKVARAICRVLDLDLGKVLIAERPR